MEGTYANTNKPAIRFEGSHVEWSDAIPTVSVRGGSALVRGLLEEALRSRGNVTGSLGQVTLFLDTPQASVLLALESGTCGPTLVVTDNPCGEYWLEVIQFAPLGFLVAPDSIREIAAAAHSVAAGVPFLRHPPYESPLWVRERRVLRLLADGLDVDAIAARLGIKTAVVRNYISSIFLKLRLSHPRLLLENRVQLINHYWGFVPS